MLYLEFAGLYNKSNEEIETFIQNNGDLGIHKFKYDRIVTFEDQRFVLERESAILIPCSDKDLKKLQGSDTIDEIRLESMKMNNIIRLLQASYNYKNFILFRNNKLWLPNKVIEQYNLRTKPSIRRENRLSKLSPSQQKELGYRLIEKNLKQEFWSAFEVFDPQGLFKHETDSLYVLEQADRVIKGYFDSYLKQIHFSLESDQKGNLSLQPKGKCLLANLWYEFIADVVLQKRPPKLCRYCGEPFTPNREWQEYCKPSEQALVKQRRYNYWKGHSIEGKDK